jgi:hypothetical protein
MKIKKFDLAEQHYQNKNYQQSLELLESSGEESWQVKWHIARCFWQLGQYQKALDFFMQAFNLESNITTCMSLVNSYIMLDEEKSAYELLVKINQAKPELVDSAAHLSLFEFTYGKKQIALKILERARIDNPNNAYLSLLLYSVNKLAGFEKACQYFPALQLDIRIDSQRRSIDFIAKQLKNFDDIKLTTSPLSVLSYALEHAQLDGHVIECGVFYGRSINYLAAKYEGEIHGFDSFEGLPEDWKTGESKGSYSTHGKLPEVASNVTLHTGWFEDTLPVFAKEQSAPICLLHIDCDLYSSTSTIFKQLGHLIRPGSVIVFDDFLGYPGFESSEFKAFYEFIENSKLDFEFICFGLMPHGAAVRIK